MSMSQSMVFARMPKPILDLLKKVAKARGEDLSSFVRRAVYKELASLDFLSESQKKALGIKDAKQQAPE